MNPTRSWLARLAPARRRFLFGVLFVTSAGAGEAAYYRWSADRQSCAAAREFADSVRANRTRLMAIDTLLAHFDLEDTLTSVGGDSARARGALDPLELTIISLRLEGATAAQIDRWMRTTLHLAPRASEDANSARDGGVQLAKIHVREEDPAYVHNMREKMQITNDYWHDLGMLAPLAERWSGRCSAYRVTMEIAPAISVLAAVGLAGAIVVMRRRAA
jgi:hypothetical protein